MTGTHHRTRCAALVLAAGQGSRFGSDKRQAQLDDTHTVLQATLARALESFDRVYVVLRPGDDPSTLGIGSRVRTVHAEHALDGMGASLAAGIDAMAASDAHAVAVLLGDMPWIATATLTTLVCQADQQSIVLPCYQGRRGHPVIFGRRFWPALARLDGDHGGRALIEANPHACQVIEVDDPGILHDIDTPGDLQRH
ncbi:NTP transferase domain-containing protein [Pseudomonas sp. SC11]|uniref:nucleotidyltransferase family protein n=1 Tax=Pseudomonas sp. SC11 TaxID=326927 RepID=UPI00399C4826